MNKLITTDVGGMPIVLDDIRWEQDANRDAIFGIMSAFGITKPTSFILSGCAVSIVGSTYSWTDGYLSLEGEICKVVAGSVTLAATTTAKWSVVETYDATGNKTFESGTSFDTYAIRTAALVQTNATFPITYMPYDAPTIHQVIAEAACPFIPQEWHLVGDSGEPAFANSWTVNGMIPAVFQPSFMKDLAGIVYLRGTASHNTSSAGNIFTLPTGYRPSETVRYVVWSAGTGSLGAALIEILANGEVHITTASLTAISLDGVSFHV